MTVLVKYDVNGYPYATVLPEFFDEEEHGAREDWQEATRTHQNSRNDAA